MICVSDKLGLRESILPETPAGEVMVETWREVSSKHQMLVNYELSIKRESFVHSMTSQK
jgi:hypothetical protein